MQPFFSLLHLKKHCVKNLIWENCSHVCHYVTYLPLFSSQLRFTANFFNLNSSNTNNGDSKPGEGHCPSWLKHFHQNLVVLVAAVITLLFPLWLSYTVVSAVVLRVLTATSARSNALNLEYSRHSHHYCKESSSVSTEEAELRQSPSSTEKGSLLSSISAGKHMAKKKKGLKSGKKKIHESCISYENDSMNQ